MRMRSGSARAWPSVVMLAGFSLVAAVLLALVTVPVWLLLSALPGSAAVRLGVPLCIATVGVMGSAIVRALHRRRTQPPGIPIGRDDAAPLWTMVDAAASAAGVAPPEGVTVIADPVVALISRSRLLGLIGGRRDLYIGMPLLQAWDAGRLRAAMAHEFGHESRALGRLAPVAYRGRVAVSRAVPRIPRNNPAGPLIRLWAGWYRRVDAPFGRAQELTADRIAAQFAGADAAAAALRDGPALETLVHVFQTEYVAPGRRAGHVPEDLFGGLLHVLAARADEMAALRHREPPEPGVWDCHPARRDRLAALSAEAARPPAGGPPAGRPPTDGPPAGGPPADGAPADGLPADGAAADGPTVDGAAADGPTVDGAAAEGPTVDGAAAEGPTVDGAATEGPAVDAAAGDGPAADRLENVAPVSELPVAVAAGNDATTPPADAPAGAVAASGETGTTAQGGDQGAVAGGRRAGGGDPPPKRGGAQWEPAADLVPDLPGLARTLQAVAFPPQGRTAVGWDAFFGAARSAEMEREAAGALSALSRAAGVPVTGAADVLDLAADGRLAKAVETIFPEVPPDEAARRIDELVTLVVALAALRTGGARWRHSWTGSAELVTPDGRHLDLARVAALSTDPATAATARERLAELGIDLTTAAARPETGDVRADVVGGVVNLVVDGNRTDLLIVDTGFFLIPALPRSQNGSAKRRLAQFAAVHPTQRDQTAAGSRFLPYADLTGAAQTRRTPKSWDLNLRSGGTLTLRTALDSDELPGGWAALDHAVAFLSRTATTA